MHATSPYLYGDLRLITTNYSWPIPGLLFSGSPDKSIQGRLVSNSRIIAHPNSTYRTPFTPERQFLKSR